MKKTPEGGGEFEPEDGPLYIRDEKEQNDRGTIQREVWKYLFIN